MASSTCPFPCAFGSDSAPSVNRQHGQSSRRKWCPARSKYAPLTLRPRCAICRDAQCANIHIICVSLSTTHLQSDGDYDELSFNLIVPDGPPTACMVELSLNGGHDYHRLQLLPPTQPGRVTVKAPAPRSIAAVRAKSTSSTRRDPKALNVVRPKPSTGHPAPSLYACGECVPPKRGQDKALTHGITP